MSRGRLARTGLAPILPRSLRALILGSFPSEASLAAEQYYAHRQNWFWRVLEACGVAPPATAPYRERVRAVKANGIGIWDLYGEVEREGSGGDRGVARGAGEGGDASYSSGESGAGSSARRSAVSSAR